MVFKDESIVNLLELRIKNQEKLKDIVLKLMQIFASAEDDVDVKLVENVSNYLEMLKNSLQLCNENIEKINTLLASINSDNESDNSENHSETFEKLEMDIHNNTFEIESNLLLISEFSQFNFENEIKVEQQTNIDEPSTEESHEEDAVSQEVKSKADDSNKEPTNDTVKREENTLIISQQASTVYLPFRKETLEETLRLHSKKYKSMEDLIQKEYTRPLKIYKNPFIARFREAFKLVKNVERGSISEAFGLGMEVMFNYNLHPAIISACRGIDELDIYLNCLDDGRTQDFDCFKIIFEVPPALK